jgi:predicted acyltransferase
MRNAWVASSLSQPGARPQPERLVSLDVFRGITIASMILVNDPGSWDHVYPPLTHADWHGWTFTDLIFPCFLFIVGVALTFSLAERKARGEGQRQIYLRTVRRTFLLFTLGLFLTNFPYYTLATLRIPGVLQRIALCYLLAVLIFMTTEVWGQIGVTIALLILYWVLMMLVPVPGYGAGVLEKEGNLAAYVDSMLLHGHLFRETWDPEGLLSTIPAVATTLLGIGAGHWLKAERSKGEKTLGLLAAGGIGVLIGQGMNLWFPINKNLWTSSYVVFTGGMALLFLGGCYWLVDGKRYGRLATPFVVFGVNPIAAYVLATLVAKLLDLYWVVGPDGTPTALKTDIYERGFASWAGPTTGSLFFALTYVGIWLVPMTVLYHKRIFLKI